MPVCMFHSWCVNSIGGGRPAEPIRFLGCSYPLNLLYNPMVLTSHLSTSWWPGADLGNSTTYGSTNLASVVMSNHMHRSGISQVWVLVAAGWRSSWEIPRHSKARDQTARMELAKGLFQISEGDPGAVWERQPKIAQLSQAKLTVLDGVKAATLFSVPRIN